MSLALRCHRERRQKGNLQWSILAMQRSNDLGEVVVEINHLVCRLLECERSSFFFVDSVQGQLWAPPCSEHDGIRLPNDCGVAGHAWSTGKVYRTNNPQEDPYWNGDVDPSRFQTRSILAAPCRHPGGKLG